MSALMLSAEQNHAECVLMLLQCAIAFSRRHDQALCLNTHTFYTTKKIMKTHGSAHAKTHAHEHMHARTTHIGARIRPRCT